MRGYWTLSMLLVLSACASGTNTVQDVIKASSLKVDNSKFAVGSSLAGVLRAPAGLVAMGGGNIVANGGGNIVANGGGNIVANGGGNFKTAFRLLGVDEAPVSGASVVMMDLKRAPIPGIKAVMTDSKGNFRFTNLSKGETMLMVASLKTENGKQAYFQTLIKAGTGLETIDIDSAATLASTRLLSRLTDIPAKELGALDLSTFRELTSLVSKELSKEKLPDFSNENAITQLMSDIEKASPDIQRRMARLEQGLAPKRDAYKPPVSVPAAPPSAPPASAPASSAPGGTPDPGASADPGGAAGNVDGSDVALGYDFTFIGTVSTCTTDELTKASPVEATITFTKDPATGKEFKVDDLQVYRRKGAEEPVGGGDLAPIPGSNPRFDSTNNNWKVKMPPTCSVILVVRSGSDILAIENVKMTSDLSFSRLDFKVTGTPIPSPTPKP